jgi:hypothetical protein
MIRNARGSARALAGLAVAATLAVGTAVTGTSPATSLVAGGDCAVAFPEDLLAAGQVVNGLTVSTGTTPEGFTGEVLGVLNDGIAPGVDMIMVQLSSSEIDRVGGIWAGMSGSPVYAEDGRLIGAVAYGLSFGPSPVAGVTPFEAMDDYLGSATLKVAVGDKAARTIAAQTDVTAAQAGDGFTQLRMPLGVSGVGAKRLSDIKGRSWLPKNTVAAGSSAAPGAGPGVETIVAGGNLAASVSYGDITMGGVGTATSVCGDRVVGFGHPMNFLGRTTEMLMPADALYVQEDSVFGPFKVANFGAPVGTLTDDRTAGITGTLGVLPDTMGITSKATFGDRSRTGSTQVSVPVAAPWAVLFELFANQDRVIDGIIAGSELQTWSISGHTASGSHWGVTLTDRYVSSGDITGEVPWDIADEVYRLSNLTGVTVDHVKVDGTANDDDSAYSIQNVQQYRAGAWHVVSKDNPIFANAGQTLNLRVSLTSVTGSKNVPVKVTVPTAASGSRGRLSLVGGAYLWSGGGSASTLPQVLQGYRHMVRNDEIRADLLLIGPSRVFQARTVAGPADKVVKGSRSIPVLIG